jgi:phosphomannomutase
MAKINLSIFKAYDVRGIYPDEINEETAYLVSKALVKFLKAKSIVAARDMRSSSVPLYDAVLRGLKEMGVKIYDLGLATTPMYMYVINLEKADGGIVVTASHNPAKYNGLRMESKFAASIGEGSGMEKIRDMVLKGKTAGIKPASKKCEIVRKNYLEKYVDFLASKFSPKDFYGLTTAVDAGNGMTGLVLPKILKKLKINYFPLYFDLDGTFPHHDADPSNPENLRDLGDFVIERGADIGVAFDGDGDRVGFVDGKGEMIDMDYISSLWAEQVLKQNEGEKIIYDLSSSKIVRETIEKNGGKALICRTGHSFFRRLIREEDAYFGCEKSGHCMLREFFYVEAAILTALHILKLVNQSGKKIGDLVAPFKKYFSVFVPISFKNREKFEPLIEKLEKEYQNAKLSRLDGLAVEYRNWWFNIRLSNTEPIVRLRVEADTQELLEEKKRDILKIIS